MTCWAGLGCVYIYIQHGTYGYAGVQQYTVYSIQYTGILLCCSIWHTESKMAYVVRYMVQQFCI